eukprot:TRINITY_DN30746_c0_g1_i1.p1 TRINITY_DN30746_c0_g1~~TRINITY_DN30746_c0_g1_i1.p1  ORF type:complete len:535 (+),score=165.66 TRINITY_DN30746_c0_g1_i1:85-1605(+)
MCIRDRVSTQSTWGNNCAQQQKLNDRSSSQTLYIIMIRNFHVRSPVTNELLEQYPFATADEIQAKIAEAQKGYLVNRARTVAERAAMMLKVADLIDANCKTYAQILTREMGKPIIQAQREVTKCSSHCRYFAEKAAEMLEPVEIKTEVAKSYVRYDPLGVIFQVIPFNFPFWLSMKGAVVILMGGNSVIHRTADSTPGIGRCIEQLFREAGFNNGEFVNVFSAPEHSETIIADRRVHGLTFIGSTRTGRILASICGKYSKKSCLELGGCDPFLVLPDADLNQAIELAVRSRSNNCGQVCISSKRFLVPEAMVDDFTEKLVQALSKIKIGDPQDETTEMGPLAREDLMNGVASQVEQSIKEGAKLVYGGKKPDGDLFAKGNYYMPTVLVANSAENHAMKEEIFGPVWTIMKYGSEEEGIELANGTEYGLGAIVFTKDVERAERDVVPRIEAGMVYVNEQVRNDSRFPSGGVKSSGYGRDCGEDGLKEFMNVKTVWAQYLKPTAQRLI